MKKSGLVIFVQGYGDYSEGVWPVWLGRELKKQGFDYINVEMPDPMFPEVQAWLAALEKVKNKLTERTYFVGHSLGCITIARFLERLPLTKRVGGCVFVSGFDSIPKIPFLSNFCSGPLNFELVRSHTDEVVVILSDNDHLVPRQDSEDFAARLGARVIVEHGKGHFKDDVSKIESVLNSILEMDQMKQELMEMKKLKALV